jgi:hypothetical protein
MTTKRFLGRGPGSPNLSEHDMAQIDRLHPELSFTGETPEPEEPEGDLVKQLEKLGGLRDEGVLTEEEFATAKARLLG